MLPRFTPHRICERDGKIEITGAASARDYRGQTWLEENWIGFIGRVGQAPVEGRWFHAEDLWLFVTDDRNALGFEEGEELCLYDGYWGDLARIVLAPFEWKRDEFAPRGRGDHEHCDICWATIEPPSSATCFRSSEQDIVCPECYAKYVVPRSLTVIDNLMDKEPIQPTHPTQRPGPSG